MTYIRKQTLANCERYITQELKELESTHSGRQRPLDRSWNIQLFDGRAQPRSPRELPASRTRPRPWPAWTCWLSFAAGGHAPTITAGPQWT